MKIYTQCFIWWFFNCLFGDHFVNQFRCAHLFNSENVMYFILSERRAILFIAIDHICFVATFISCIPVHLIFFLFVQKCIWLYNCWVSGADWKLQILSQCSDFQFLFHTSSGFEHRLLSPLADENSQRIYHSWGKSIIVRVLNVCLSL